MKAVIVFISSRINKPEESKIREECYVLAMRWLSFINAVNDNSTETIDLFYKASHWYEQYRKVLSAIGIKSQDKNVIVNPSMEEKLVRKLEQIIETHLQRK